VAEQILGGLIVALLLTLAVWFGRRQFELLRDRAMLDDLPPEDRRYVRRQAWRRLVGCLLMVLLAILISGWYLLGFHQFANELRNQDTVRPEQRETLRWCVYYGIGSLVILLGMLGVAALDLLAIRSYALRHHRQIQADRRAMIERQVARMRQQGNGRDTH
jgi:ABC-type Fe3+ transport system permease subunit